ncbi:MAG: MFS transporter [Acidobacteria bacterium]|nr:MFS transporter [Acidobacteriota bacterium]
MTDPPASRARPGSWGVLAAYVAVVASSHILWISLVSVKADAARVFSTTELSIGLLVTIGPFCSAAFSIPAGILPDRIGYRVPILWAGMATGVFGLIRAFSGSFPVLLALTVAMLIPQPFLINAVADVVNRHFRKEETATASGVGTMAIFLGITIGVALTPFLAGAVGIRGSQVVYGGAALAATAVFWRVAPRRVPERLAVSGELPAGDALRRVVRSRTLWVLSAIIFCGFGFYLGMTTWLEDILKPRGIDASQAGLVAGTITIAGILGSVALGTLSDRIGRRRPFLIAAGAVAAPTLWMLGHLGSFGSLEATAFVMGFFMLAALPVSIAMISEEPSLGPQVASTAVGVVLLAGNLGGVAVVAAMGLLKDAQGNFSGAVALTSILALVAVVIAATALRPAARAAARGVVYR